MTIKPAWCFALKHKKGEHTWEKSWLKGRNRHSKLPGFLSNWLLAQRGIVNIKLGEAHT